MGCATAGVYLIIGVASLAVYLGACGRRWGKKVRRRRVHELLLNGGDGDGDGLTAEMSPLLDSEASSEEEGMSFASSTLRC